MGGMDRIVREVLSAAERGDQVALKALLHPYLHWTEPRIDLRGRVKVLDFGLAKITQTTASPDQISDSQLATRVKTSPGVIMGTVNYMSPEQASGKEVDARTDIWSVGVVLYEMLTGRVPFEGTTPSHIIVAILEKEPLPLSAYVPNAPEALEWIVTETLTKDPAERTQTARELMKKLQRLKQRVDADAEVERSVSPVRLSAAEDINKASIRGVSGSTVPPAPTISQTSQPPTGEVAPTPTHLSSAEYVVNQINSHKKAFVLATAIALVVLAGIAFAIYKFIVARRSPIISLETANFRRLTTTGNATGAVISPDGKWLVHVQDDGQQKSLWLQQVAVANSTTQIVPPANVGFYGLAFSPDGNYVYYVVGTSGVSTGTLYQVPVLGGTPRKLFTGIKSSLSFSPDGKQMAYFDFYEDEDRLMIASADGSGQRQLAMRHGDEFFFEDDFATVSWSPDGKILATPVANARENYMSIATVSVATGEVKFLTPRRWSEVRQAVWFDASTVLATIQEKPGEAFSIWQVGYPSGTATKLTNDLNWYTSISLTADKGSIAAVKFDVEDNIWIMPAFDASRATQITQGRNLVATPGWTADGKLVCPIKAAVGGDLYQIDPDTGNRKQLTADSGDNIGPSVSSDGRYIVFISDRTGGPYVWRMDIDGSNAKQLTQTAENQDANISPDGRWVTYTSCLNKCTLWKVSIDGGQPVQLTDRFSQSPVFSPDGKQIACRYLDQPNGQYQLAILPSEGGAPIRTFPIPNGAITARRWTVDGRALIYGITQKGVTNLWSQPIDGSPPKQLTNFASEIIFGFDLSRDGKQVALARGTESSDVVLISNFKR